MTNKNEYSWDPRENKDIVEDEAWQYFKPNENLPPNLNISSFLESKDYSKDLKNKWDAFRHVYTSAKFTKIYDKDTAKWYGDLNELRAVPGLPKFFKGEGYEGGNKPGDRNMDLNNNHWGRKIGSENKNPGDLLKDVYHAINTSPDIIINPENPNNPKWNESKDKNKPWHDFSPIKQHLWNYGDSLYGSKSEHKPSLYTKELNLNLDNINKQMSSQGLPQYDFSPIIKQKIWNYGDSLYGSKSEHKPPLYTKEGIDRMSKEELNLNLDNINKQISSQGLPLEENLKKDYFGFRNPHLGVSSQGIFTEEDLNSMKRDDILANQRAIEYQTANIGVPSKLELEYSRFFRENSSNQHRRFS